MLIEVKRKWFTDRSTVGVMTLDGYFFSYTMEDVARAEGVKIYGKTAIPNGEYSLTMQHSPRFNRILPKIHKVPLFEGVLIHRLNYAEESHGCIGVGLNKARDVIWRSGDAEEMLCKKISEAISGRGELVCLKITNNPT